MADTKLTSLSAITAAVDADTLYIVDVSDTTDDPAGSSRKITKNNLYKAFEENTNNNDILTLRFEDSGTKWSVGTTADFGFTIERVDDDGALALAGGITSANGAAMVLTGGSATNASDWRIQCDNVDQISWDNSAGSLTIYTGTTKVQNMVLSNDTMKLGRTGAASTVPYSIFHEDTDQGLQISGGSTVALGANILMYGEAHGSLPDAMYFRQDATAWFAYDGTDVLMVLPTTDPAKANALWANSGVVTVSSG